MGCGASKQPRDTSHQTTTQAVCHNMILAHYSDVDHQIRHDHSRMEWEALFYVQANDVARLLREGLHMSEGNIVPGTGCITPGACPDSLGQHGWVHGRRYVMRGANGGGWTAHVVVGARELRVLAEFRPQHVTNKMAYAQAWNSQGLMVFRHDAFDATQQHRNDQYAFPISERVK